MGKKHRRNTAKTGDKALYKQGQVKQSKIHDGEGINEDAMYSKVDQFYNQKDEEDFIQLSQQSKKYGQDDDDDDDAEILQQEAVLDLGGGDVSSSDADEGDEHDEDDDDEDEDGHDDDDDGLGKQTSMTLDQATSSGSHDDEDEDLDDVRNWGTRKSVYYHGDTADLEIGQEQEDAFVEEEAAKEVHMARMKEMSEEDFVLSDAEDDNDEEGNLGKNDKSSSSSKKGKPSSSPPSSKTTTLSSQHLSQHRDTSSWSTKEQRTFLRQHHPEFCPLVTHFTDVVRDFDRRTNVVVRALYEQQQDKNDRHKSTAKEVGATVDGERYLLSRALLQSSAALNLTIYLLLKSEYAAGAEGAMAGVDESIMNSHPVLDHLQKLHRMAEIMEKNVTGSSSSSSRSGRSSLNEQMNHLVKASALLENGEVDDEEDDDDDDDDDHPDDVENDSSEPQHSEKYGKSLDQAVDGDVDVARIGAKEDVLSDDDDDDDDHEEAIKARQEAALMNEARFSLRLNEVGSGGDEGPGDVSHRKRRRQRRAAPDFGDDENDDDVLGQNSSGKAASRVLASTVNALEQRFAASEQKRRKKSPGMSSSGPTAADQLDELNKDDEENEVRRGLELMEAELGKLDDSNNDGVNDDDGDGMDGDDDDDMAFYRKMEKASRNKKQQRKDKYAVAPKFPRLDPQAEGERAISRTILKNRGLVPHKNKLNRNPRVKKREQYRKALIRRRGAVRDVRDPREGYVYGGEETGIKSGIRRSRNLS